MIYPSEQFIVTHKYFQPAPNCIAPVTVKQDREKELRMLYRAGHLDELKRKLFAKVYSQTRKHYMDLELSALKSRNNTQNMQKNKPKFSIKQHPGVYIPEKYRDKKEHSISTSSSNSRRRKKLPIEISAGSEKLESIKNKNNANKNLKKLTGSKLSALI